jgi:hypothetical protein
MQSPRPLRSAAVAGLVLCLTVSAQAAEPPAPAPAPETDAPAADANRRSGVGATRLVVPPYRSVLDGYGRYRADEPLRDWREVNDEVGRLGGHGGHLQGGAQPGAAQ